ncbi:hypothetical protein PENVUL_c050G05887 [Penicillium vulpinum]|uniref:Uncharacterized protein n=1 Tax=Penicillium vulpinum TaxID=29845 RepID=A0A1V6RGK1_9EURO|nr:hypothetical protein PENVUL_c050G05887 [Penicillium vulpinum]
MPSYKDNPPDQEYLNSIKKHTDKGTNKVNLALVAKDFDYASGKSFQKKYAKLKKLVISSTDAAPTQVAQTPPKETTTSTESFMEKLNRLIEENEKEQQQQQQRHGTVEIGGG